MNHTRILRNNNRVTSSKLPSVGPQATGSFTLRFVFDGAEQCFIGRRRLDIQNDTFLVLNPGTRFTNIPGPDATVLTIELDAEYLNNFFVNANNIHALTGIGSNNAIFLPELAETVYPFKMEIKNAAIRLKDYLEEGEYDEEQLSLYVDRCLVTFYNIYNEEIIEKARKLNFLHYSTRVEILRRLNLAKEYLYANYSRNVSLESLADHSCLSVNHLLRTFKLAYNQSPHQFLIQLRLQRAQLLLAKTEYPIYTIVTMVGFKCTSSFIRLFRTRYKTTPLKYRNVLAA